MTVVRPSRPATLPDRPGDRAARLAAPVLRRWPTFLAIAVLLVLLALHVVAEVADGIVWAAVLYLMWSAVRGDLRRGRVLAVQLAAVAAFGAVGLVAAGLHRPWAAYLLAFGWLAHAVWDAVHLRLAAIVPRWYAESCAVLDGLLVISLLVLA